MLPSSGCGLVLLWQHCDMSFTSGFVDDRLFAHSAPTTTLYVLCGLQEGVRLYLGDYDDLLAKLYKKQLAKVKVAGTLSEWFRVKKGVRQGCVLSPYLFNILAEVVMRETLDGFQGGLQIGGRMITNLRC